MSPMGRAERGIEIDAVPSTVSAPEGMPGSSKVMEGHVVLDLENYIPYFITSINNALNSGSSQLYLQRFGVGVVEWRVAAMLAIEPRIPAARICEVVALDKAATSRALTKLYRGGYVDYEEFPRDPRRKIWWLNGKGQALHAEIIAIALERERVLLDGLAPQDRATVLSALRIMHVNVQKLGGPDQN